MAEKIKVVIVEQGKPARIAQIEYTLENMQEIVGGYITTSYPFNDRVAVVCDDEGAYKYPLNRALNKYKAWFGTFFICGLTEEDFGSLTDEQAQKYQQMFKKPEAFLRDGASGRIIRLRPGEKPVAIS